MYRSYRLYLGKLETEKRHAEQVSSLHLRTIEALALAIEAKDQTTGEHLERVRVYAMELARDLGLTEDETEALRAASVPERDQRVGEDLARYRQRAGWKRTVATPPAHRLHCEASRHAQNRCRSHAGRRAPGVAA